MTGWVTIPAAKHLKNVFAILVFDERTLVPTILGRMNLACRYFSNAQLWDLEFSKTAPLLVAAGKVAVRPTEHQESGVRRPRGSLR